MRKTHHLPSPKYPLLSKNNRSTGPDSIPPELLKVDEPELVNALHKIMVKIWETEKFPLNGKKALSAPFLKKKTNLNVVTIGELLALTRHIKYSPTCCLQDCSLILTKLYKEPQVTQVIRSNRLRWLGHIWRSPENKQTRAYTFQNPMGSRTRGRRPTRWI
ncbi:endonuclease-reverse transcriptase [Trichonephila clavipes]|nr:endonuclease-reverse transcriptase [Trichonephila clavipes]